MWVWFRLTFISPYTFYSLWLYRVFSISFCALEPSRVQVFNTNWCIFTPLMCTISFLHSWITVVNKLLCPELRKTNQIWAEDICISWGTGLDLEVISYEPVLNRHRCNVSMSSTFNCSLCEPSLSSKSDSQREGAQLLNTACKPSEAKHLGMGFNQDGAEWSPIHAHPHMEGITGKKFRLDTDTNSGARPVLESG